MLFFERSKKILVLRKRNSTFLRWRYSARCHPLTPPPPPPPTMSIHCHCSSPPCLRYCSSLSRLRRHCRRLQFRQLTSNWVTLRLTSYFSPSPFNPIASSLSFSIRQLRRWCVKPELLLELSWQDYPLPVAAAVTTSLHFVIESSVCKILQRKESARSRRRRIYLAEFSDAKRNSWPLPTVPIPIATPNSI